MRGMILAAGRGVRMGALTDNTPKPLLKVNGHYLIEYAIHALLKSDIRNIVINLSYRGEQIQEALGDGSRYGVHLQYSIEPDALETAGGIIQALPLLGDQPFIVMSSDIITDYPLQQLCLQAGSWAHLVLVDNPPYHPEGDFGLHDQQVSLKNRPFLTYGNIGIYDPQLFIGRCIERCRLGDLLKPAIQQGRVTGEYYTKHWQNIGTPDDWVRANAVQEIPHVIHF